MKISIQIGLFSFLKYTFIIFAAHLSTSCGAPFENHCTRDMYVQSAYTEENLERA
jgi:hypothetical protein